MDNKQKVFLSNLAGWASIVGNILLFIGKFYVGLISSSVALIADAVHTLSDSISSIILLIGIKISNRPSDKEHPFGHGRAELISALLIGFLLGGIALEFGIGAINKLKTNQGSEFGTLAIVITIISIIAKELMAQFTFFVAKKTELQSIKADGWHHRSDAISSIVVLIGIYTSRNFSSFWWIDAVLGLIISGFLLYVAWKIVINAINPLLGESASEELIDLVRQICHDKLPFEFDLHHFHLHQYGCHRELTFHLVFAEPLISLEKAHYFASIVENELKEMHNIYATIHMETK